jgi:hypothetical protein
MMEKIPHTIDKYTFCWKYGFGIGYGTGQKYPPIWVAVSVSNLDQNRGFGRTLWGAIVPPCSLAPTALEAIKKQWVGNKLW